MNTADLRDLVRAGQAADALTVLSDPEYTAQKARYSQGLAIVLAQLEQTVTTRLQLEHTKAVWAAVLAVVVLVTSLSAWLLLARRLRTWQRTLTTELAERHEAVTTYLAFAEDVARGDLSQRLVVQYSGALGALAQGLNAMVTDLQQLQQAEVQNRTVLERSVAHYLAFTQQVAQGDLTQCLDDAGTLGQLGHGLNAMVASLHQITARVQQANADISAAAAEILAATTQQAAGAAEQSAAIAQTTTTIAEVKAIAHQTAH